MALYGYKLYDSNSAFRILLIGFAGMAIMAVLVSWRAQTLFNAEYVEFPRAHRNTKTIIRPETDLEKQQRELNRQLN